MEEHLEEHPLEEHPLEVWADPWEHLEASFVQEQAGAAVERPLVVDPFAQALQALQEV